MSKKTIISFLLLSAILFQAYTALADEIQVDIIGPPSVKIGDENGGDYYLQYGKYGNMQGNVELKHLESTDWEFLEPNLYMDLIVDKTQKASVKAKVIARKQAKFVLLYCYGLFKPIDGHSTIFLHAHPFQILAKQ